MRRSTITRTVTRAVTRTLAAPSASSAAPTPLPRSFRVSMWAVPTMVVGQFAFLAVVPVGVLVRDVVREPGLRTLREPVLTVGALYAAPMAVWILRRDRARSLSRDMHPAFVALITAAGVRLLAVSHLRGRGRA